MTRTVLAGIVILVGVVGLVLTTRAQDERPAPEPKEPPTASCPTDRVLVKMKPGVDAATVVARYGGTIVQTIPGVELQVVTVPAGTGQQVLDALNADADVQYAEADAAVRAPEIPPPPGCP